MSVTGNLTEQLARALAESRPGRKFLRENLPLWEAEIKKMQEQLDDLEKVYEAAKSALLSKSDPDEKNGQKADLKTDPVSVP